MRRHNPLGREVKPLFVSNIRRLEGRTQLRGDGFHMLCYMAITCVQLVLDDAKERLYISLACYVLAVLPSSHVDNFAKHYINIVY